MIEDLNNKVIELKKEQTDLIGSVNILKSEKEKAEKEVKSTLDYNEKKKENSVKLSEENSSLLEKNKSLTEKKSLI